MGMTIGQLVGTSFLRTSYLAGRSGGTRSVNWAHTCELPDPWNWLGDSELLLTDGYNFPAEEDEQVTFLHRLSDAGLAGIALAAGMHAPPLTAAAVRAADTLSFPILETEYSVPFVAVARTVADHNSKAAVNSLAKILRVYDVLHHAHRGSPQRRGLLDQLQIEAGARLHVLDVVTGHHILESRSVLSEQLRHAIVDELAHRARPLPTFTRVQISDRHLLIIPLSGSKTVLVAEPLRSSDAVELVLLQHIATIAELEITHQAQDAEIARASSSRLLEKILDGSLTSAGIDARLEQWGFGNGPMNVVAVAMSDAQGSTQLVERLFRSGIRHLWLQLYDIIVILTDSTAELLDRVDFESTGRSAGISLPVGSPERIPDAVREARWALEVAAAATVRAATYGDEASLFLPRTLAEANFVVDRLLGPLIRHDAAEGSDLLATLQAYFDADRSWQVAARLLNVHKQTVVYRIRKIESLTGRSLRDVGDQSELFLALRSWRITNLRMTSARHNATDLPHTIS